jgi:hypothetical protein
MRRVTAFVIPALFACVASGQTQQTFNFTAAASVQDFQETSTLIRTVSAIQDTSTDNEQKSLTVKGTAEQIALAGWLFKELDKAPSSADPAPAEYRAGDNDLVKVYYINRASDVKNFQEISIFVRTVTEIRTAFTQNARKALALRGAPYQLALADFVISELNQISIPESPAAHEYRIPPDLNPPHDGDTVRIYYLPGTKTVQDFQEVANMARTMTGIRAAFTYNQNRAFGLRASADEIAFADWLLHQLNSNGQDEYRVPNASDDVARVFYLTNTATTQAFQQQAAQIRSATNIRRAFIYGAQRALALRGTVTQIALAEQMVKDLDSPKPETFR